MPGLAAVAFYAPLEGFFLRPVLRLLTAAPAGSVPPEPPAGGDPGFSSLWYALFVGSLVAPLLEETGRGYMLPRIVELFGFGRRGWAASLLLSSLLLGSAHAVNPL